MQCRAPSDCTTVRVYGPKNNVKGLENVKLLDNPVLRENSSTTLLLGVVAFNAVSSAGVCVVCSHDLWTGLSYSCVERDCFRT